MPTLKYIPSLASVTTADLRAECMNSKPPKQGRRRTKSVLQSVKTDESCSLTSPSAPVLLEEFYVFAQFCYSKGFNIFGKVKVLKNIVMNDRFRNSFIQRASLKGEGRLLRSQCCLCFAHFNF